MADAFDPQDLARSLLHILEETFEDPPQPGQGNVYLDKQTAWVQTLEEVSAERASRPVAPGGTTVAAQVAHARYYLEVVEGFMRGREPALDWPGSWRVQEVTPEMWEELRASLMSTYQRVAELLRTTERWDDDRITDALAVLVHSAYHLGAVRQMLRLV